MPISISNRIEQIEIFLSLATEELANLKKDLNPVPTKKKKLVATPEQLARIRANFEKRRIRTMIKFQQMQEKQ